MKGARKERAERQRRKVHPASTAAVEPENRRHGCTLTGVGNREKEKVVTFGDLPFMARDLRTVK